MTSSGPNDLGEEVLSGIKRELLRKRLNQARAGLGQLPLIPRRSNSELDAPLSFSQQRLWFLDQFGIDRETYNLSAVVRVVGPLNVKGLEEGLNEVARRHEVLRARFISRNGEPFQVIGSAERQRLPVIDLQEMPVERQEAIVQSQILAAARWLFDLSLGPLLRVILLRLFESEHVLLVTMHHIVADGWSMGILIKELMAVYMAFLNGQPAPLSPLPIQYTDFAYWQRDQFRGNMLEAETSYWREQLADLPTLQLSTDRPRPPMQTFRGAQQVFVLPRPLCQKLKALCLQEKTTFFIVLIAAFKTLLHRYTGQNDLIVGTDSANRNRAEVEGLIGLFVNQLALRSRLTGKPTFVQFLAHVRQVCLDAFAHQDLPFEKMVEAVDFEWDPSRHPVFQVAFSLHNFPMYSLGTNQPFVVETTHNGTARLDLGIEMMEIGQELHGFWEYNTDLFETATIERMIRHFQTLLEGIVADPGRRLSDLPLLTETEERELHRLARGNSAPFPLEECPPQVFERQAQKTPDAIVVICGDKHLTYNHLNLRANRMAGALRGQGVGTEVLVALLIERGLEYLTAMLAVFKAGGAYLPLDPNDSSSRADQILAQSDCGLVLTETQHLPLLSQAMPSGANSSPPVLLISEILEAEHSQGEADLSVGSAPNSLAYVIYTSGSTGRPKGAMVEQRGMLNHLWVKMRDLNLTPADRVAQTASPCFDISVWQFWAAPLSGGCVVVFPDEVAKDARRLLGAVEQYGVSVWESVPTLLQIVIENIKREPFSAARLSGLRWMISTGEALPPALSRRWCHLSPMIPLLNAYGPTECSDDVAHYLIASAPDSDELYVPLGRPIANIQLYVLDPALRLVPPGVIGELYVGGIGVGRGYKNDPAQTAEKFLPDPFGATPGARLYRTGDQVRCSTDGDLIFIGRADFQVKIRGFRIELGEIEAALFQHPAIRESLVVVREDAHREKQLVAYIVFHNKYAAISSPDLRDFLVSRLPKYMVPFAFVVLEQFPLTSNGKVNRNALPAPDTDSTLPVDRFVPPRTPVERTLVTIWQEVLGVNQVGLFDNFFEIGGHSLLATRLVWRIEETFHVVVPLRMVFEAPTIAELTLAIAKNQAEGIDADTLAQALAEIEAMPDDQAGALLAEETDPLAVPGQE